MPNKPSAMKELRKTRKRTLHNVKIKTHVRVLFGKAKELAAKGETAEAKQVMVSFQKAIDKAVKVKVVSKNRANRKKSALMRMVLKPKQ